MKKILSIFIIFITVQFSFAQNETVLTIENEKITMAEFLAIYNKNRNIGEEIDKKSIQEYMELFINFKLKVKEAENMGLDTVPSFINELEGYRKQLAAPYLIDKKIDENLLQEAYNRLLEEVRASHVLIALSPDALPKDTLKMYNTALEIRKQFYDGEAFSFLAKKYSEDPSVKENNGDLGYFTALYMLYPFENGAYNTPKGEVSMPIRTQFGYHLIYVTDKRPAQGQIKVAHIMTKIPEKSDSTTAEKAKTKIFEIYNKLENGEDFDLLTKNYSEDNNTANKGGELPWFGTGMMYLPFETASFALSEFGDYSPPIQTPIGWHIIKLIDKKGVGSFDETKEEIKKKINRDSRSELSKKSVINRLKKEYKFSVNKKAKEQFYSLVDETFFSRQWKIDSTKKLSNTLFTLSNLSVTQEEFANYITLQQRRNYKKQTITALIDFMFNQFADEKILNYEESLLEQKYPEFKALIKEYHHGILLFELTDKLVWSKAVEDTLGLEKFYNKHISNYMWGDRADATIVTCESENIAKKAQKYLKRGKTSDWITKKLNTNNPLAITFTQDLYSKDDNDIIDAANWEEEIGPILYLDGKFKFIQINNVLKSQPKKIHEARGAITSDYQAYLEANWVKELRKKYIYEVNYDVLLGTNKKTQEAEIEEEPNNVFEFNGILIPIYLGSFKEAFKQARIDLGKNDFFAWGGKPYHTNYATEIK